MLNVYTFDYGDEIRALLHRFATDEAAVDTDTAVRENGRFRPSSRPSNLGRYFSASGNNMNLMAIDDSDAYHVYHDWGGGEELSASIGRGLANVMGRSLEDPGPPLYDVVDPDALESLLEPFPTRERTVDFVSFTIGDYSVKAFNEAGTDVCHIVIRSLDDGITPAIREHA